MLAVNFLSCLLINIVWFELKCSKYQDFEPPGLEQLVLGKIVSAETVCSEGKSSNPELIVDACIIVMLISFFVFI